MIHKFKKWLSGEITWKEEKELRKEAANDSALADAIEGYEQFPKSDHLQKIHQLNKRVRQQTSSQESRNKFPLRAIAASFIVLVAVGLFWMVNQNLIPTVSDSTAYQIPAETRVSKEAIETSPTQTQSKQRTPIASLPTPAVPTAENKSFNNDVGTAGNMEDDNTPNQNFTEIDHLRNKGYIQYLTMPIAVEYQLTSKLQAYIGTNLYYGLSDSYKSLGREQTRLRRLDISTSTGMQYKIHPQVDLSIGYDIGWFEKRKNLVDPSNPLPSLNKTFSPLEGRIQLKGDWRF